MDQLPKVDKQAHAGSSKVPPEVREIPTNEYPKPLQDAYDDGNIDPLPVEEAEEPVYPKLATLNGEQAPKKSRKLMWGIIGGVAAAGIVAGSVIGITSSANQGPKEEGAPVNPDGTSEEFTYPAEATEFMENFGDRYDDPVATYYSDAAYQEIYGTGMAVNEGYIADYVIEDGATAEVSPLGFQLNKLEPGAEITNQVVEDVFNANLSSMNSLINYLAKNPSIEYRTVIADEFTDYNGYQNPNASGIVQMLEGITAAHGSNANYEIKPAVSYETEDDNELSVFRGENFIIDSVDENGNVNAFNKTVDLTVEVTTYNDEGESTVTTERIDLAQFSVARAPSANDPMNVGLIGIGLR